MYSRSNLKLSLVIFTILLRTSMGSAQELDTTKSIWKPSPSGAAFRSLAIPGWGQAYNGNPVKAVIYGGIEQALIYGMYRNHLLFKLYKGSDRESDAGYYSNERNRLTWYLAGAMILSIMDAFVDAHLYNFDVSDDFSARDIESGLTIGNVNVNFTFRVE